MVNRQTNVVILYMHDYTQSLTSYFAIIILMQLSLIMKVVNDLHIIF